MRGRSVLTAFAAAAVAPVALMVVTTGPEPARASAPQDCFWTSVFDERNGNAFYPDTAVNYYLGRVSLPPEATLVMRGRFPHARYMSFNAYDEAGRPTDALADFRIRPERGATNPFRAGNLRHRPRRDYTVRVVAAPPPQQRRRNTVYLGSDGRPTFSGSVVYRVYLPDRGRNQFGGTGLPEVALRLPDGTEVDQPAACFAPTNQPNTGLNAADRRSSGPRTRALSTASDPLDWERFFNMPRSVVRAASEETAAQMSDEQQGGFFSDQNNAYISAFTSRSYGDVLVLTGRLPAVSRTHDRVRMFRSGQLRYWSMCNGTIFPSGATETVDCVFDEEVVTRDARFRIVVSTPEDRPANARRRCGVTWMAWGARPDGVMIMRNQLPSPGFDRAVQDVRRPGAESRTLGPFMPRGSYTSTRRFESRGCPRG
ncbi:MAG: hypothetical protein M3211_02025 [Actinomycetota bacterium]|nr:hypothetical protein [Actinomycetota bacterium]